MLVAARGTSCCAGSVAKYWLESIAKIPTSVEVASEYRYRDSVPNPRTLVVTITQSGETADTLAALKHARSLGMTHTLTVCNVSTSAMVRECEFAYITRAGVEIGVASTKAFSTQLVGLRVRHGSGQTEEPGQERGRRMTVALLRRTAPAPQARRVAGLAASAHIAQRRAGATNCAISPRA